MKARSPLLILGPAAVLPLLFLLGGDDTEARPGPGGAEFGAPSPLPLPARMSVGAYEKELFAFLNGREYRKLGWCQDKGVRDTGPFVDGKYHGTHPTVRVFYSPGVVRWLMAGRAGPLPDGEMIIKEQYPPPAARHRGKSEEELWASLESWTVMVKDSRGSHDGWFWSNPAKGQCVIDNHQDPFPHPISGFGLYCVRCHASTQSPGTGPAEAANEFTFAALRNIAGFPGVPIQFRVDDSWRKEGKAETTGESHPRCTRPAKVERPARKADVGFLDLFRDIRPVALADVIRLPPVTHDWAIASREPGQGFVTSNQCMSCHAGLTAPFGPAMFVPAKEGGYGDPGWDVSPFGEWRWTPMGLAGRDPIFLAQLENERERIRREFWERPAFAHEVTQELTATCLRCHGAMGKHQFDRDHEGKDERFGLRHQLATAGPDKPLGHGKGKYGALARDGISCMVCHRMQPRPQPTGDRRPYLQFFLETSITGNIHLGKKGEIYGPFKDEEIAPYIMEHATGWKPKHSPYLKSSQLCGTCHTVSLPAVDHPLDPKHHGHHDEELIRSESVPLFRKFHHHVEQATYLEWLNSAYENELYKDNPTGQSCQECHMSAGLKDAEAKIDLPEIRTRIAAVQDSTYPDAENLPGHEALDIRLREKGYRRHDFTGLNVFLLELFNQFDDVLGVPRDNFMTGGTKDLEHAEKNFLRTAREKTATVSVRAERAGPGRITARVEVVNKAGHRFPSGVAFRRAFLELLVVRRDDPEKVVWSSGRTSPQGVLLGADGKPLPTEFFRRGTGRQPYQQHHEVITSPDQVQVYETLMWDNDDRFTTSFVHGCTRVKDNRLLPRGWKREGPGGGLTGAFLKATHPGEAAARDPRYGDGSGSDEVVYRITLPAGVDPADVEVRAALYYQAIPPYFLANLFSGAPSGPATRRLHYLCSHVNLKGTPIEGWKLRITSGACEVD